MLDGVCFMRNSRSEKRGELVSKGCLLKVDNDIFNKNPQEIESDCSMSYRTVIFLRVFMSSLSGVWQILISGACKLGSAKYAWTGIPRKRQNSSNALKLVEYTVQLYFYLFHILLPV